MAKSAQQRIVFSDPLSATFVIGLAPVLLRAWKQLKEWTPKKENGKGR